MSILLRCSLLLAFFVSIYAQEIPRVAIATLTPQISLPDLMAIPPTAILVIRETDDGLLFTGTITGLAAGRYVVRVHERGDVTTCLSAGGVFIANSDVATVDVADTSNEGPGIVIPVTTFNVTSTVLALRGDNNMLGRSVVVHAATGNTRVLCGVPGITSPLTSWNSAATSSPSLLLFIGAAIFGSMRT